MEVFSHSLISRSCSISYSIHLSTASTSDSNRADIWIGLRRAKNGNFYWPISGKQVKHRKQENIWLSGYPKENGGDCVSMNLSKAKHVKNSFMNYPCNQLLEFYLCQIPFAS